MIVIRRMVDRRKAYTAIFLQGEPPKIFPTSDAEHARILQLYKQDRPHEGILNDFSDYFPPPDAVKAEAQAKGAVKVKGSAKAEAKTKAAGVSPRGRASSASEVSEVSKRASVGKRRSGGSSHRVAGEAAADEPLWIVVADGANLGGLEE